MWEETVVAYFKLESYYITNGNDEIYETPRTK
jgi:hypothetical protein